MCLYIHFVDDFEFKRQKKKKKKKKKKRYQPHAFKLMRQKLF